jgi:hypothetical protein
MEGQYESRSTPFRHNFADQNRKGKRENLKENKRKMRRGTRKEKEERGENKEKEKDNTLGIREEERKMKCYK